MPFATLIKPLILSFAWVTRLFVLGLLCAFGTMAQAQTEPFDWVVNINDAGFDPISAGGTIEYVVEVNNNNTLLSSPATTITLDVPANTTLIDIGTGFSGCMVGASPLGTPVNTGPSGLAVTCDVPLLLPTASATSVIQVQTLQVGVIELMASVPTTDDRDVANNMRSEETTVSAGADLQISLTADGNLATGDFINFDITVVNNGPNTATGHTIEFPIPAGVTNLTGAGGAALPADCVINGTTVQCTITTALADSAALVRSFQGQVSAAGGSTITSSASVLNVSPTDPISTNNTDTASTVIDDGTDVSIDISRPDTNTLVVGEMVTFTVTSAYTGNAPTDLEISTTIPANYTVNNVSSPDGWLCDPVTAAGVLTCTLADPTTPGIDVPLGSILIDVTATSVGNPNISTTISVGAQPPETNFGNNTDNQPETIAESTVDLRANKTGPNPAIAASGDTIAYVISSRNVGTASFAGTVRMVDTLPAGMSVSSIVENGWTCTTAVNAGISTVTCDLVYSGAAPLPISTTTPQVTINALVSNTATGSLENVMTVSTPVSVVETNFDNNTTGYTISVQTTVPEADLDLNQYVALPSLDAGEVQIAYIEIINIGPDTASNVRVNETFDNLINNAVGPTGAGFISATVLTNPNDVGVGTSCSSTVSGTTGRALLCTVTQLPVCTPGTQATPGAAPTGGTCPVVAVEFRPDAPVGTRTHRASISSTGTIDPNTANRFANISYVVVGDIDVTVSKSVTPDQVAAGQDLTYVITARNLAPDAGAIASAVTITDDLPDNVRFVSAVPSAGTCSTQPGLNDLTSGSQVICDLGAIDSGEQQTVTIVVRPASGTNGSTLTNNVSVASITETVGNEDNNTASADALITPPVFDVLVNKDDSVDPVLVGQNTVYTLTVTNAGPSAAEDVVLTDVLPASIFAYRSHIISGGGTCGVAPTAANNTPTPATDANLRTVQCTFPYLEEDQSETIQVTMEAVDQGTIINNVSITSPGIVAGFDTQAGNNQTSETTTARRRADISVASKTPSVTTVNLREGFDFEIVVVNNPDLPGFEASDVLLQDNLPTGMVLTGTPTAVVNLGTTTLNSCTGVADDTSFTCSFGTASADAEILITAPVKVISITAQGETFTNTAAVGTTSFDSNPNNNDAMGSVTVNASSLAGTVYRDFDNSATIGTSGQDLPLDTGITGIIVTLTGPAVDGVTLTEMATTIGDGTYVFPFLPAGTYTVTRGTVNEAGLTTGQNTIGSLGGSAPSTSQFTGVVLPVSTVATDYDFAEVPQAATPAIALIKTANLSALTTPAEVGQLVTYNFQITNTGNVALSNVTLTDAVANVTLNGSPIASLAPGETNTNAYSATYPLQPGDIGGQISNTATVTGTPPGGGSVSDISGTTFTNDTPTTTNIPNLTPAPAISLNKTVDDSETQNGGDVGDVLTYGFVVTNTGNVTLFDVTVTDTLPGIVLSGTPIATLAPGQSDSTSYTATYTLTQTDVNANQVINDARVDGTYPQNSGQTVSDTDSETVTYEPQDIDAIPETFPPFTDGGTTTTMLASDLLNGGPVTLDNVTLTVLREDDGVTLDPVTTLITLAPGLPAGAYEVDYQICSIADPDLCDIATEVVVQAALPAIEATKTQDLVDNGDGFDGVGDTLIYQITIENTGNTSLSNVVLTDTLTDLNDAALTLSSGPSFVSSTAGSPEGQLAIGEVATYSATFVMNAQAIAATGVQNTVLAVGTPPEIPGVPDIPTEVSDVSDNGIDNDGNTQDDPTVIRVTPSVIDGDVTLTKSTTSDVVRRGDAVPYLVTLRNETSGAAGPFTLVDTLPSGFIFIPGSASITPSEILPGRITWNDLSVPANTVLEITLSARVLTGARAGDHTNVVNLFDPVTGETVVPQAEATVRLAPEAVFDCGEVIGKVFTDLNGDGYQNDPGAARETGITDQSFAGGKGGKLARPPLPQTEKGIPNVRLVTVDGSIITTDEHGRYSVPCAALPEDRGSNFILKLDTRTLPSGYRVTTENPRVVRLTPGMMSELNFGATIGKVVRVDLDASAFGVTEGGNVALSAPLKAGIAQLLPKIAGEAINLRLTFHVPQNADAAYIKSARQMLRAADKHIKREWRKVGHTRLLVEHAIARVGQ